MPDAPIAQVDALVVPGDVVPDARTDAQGTRQGRLDARDVTEDAQGFRRGHQDVTDAREVVGHHARVAARVVPEGVVPGVPPDAREDA